MTLPPGFRFHPTDEELVSYYLRKRVKGIAIEFDVIADVDLYKCEPWDLPSKSRLPSSDLEWFFFSPRDRKYPNGARTNRATEAGYWKATGRDRFVKTGSKTIGMKKTLVFYMGRAPHGERTDWLMHEYRLDGEEWESTNVSQDAYVLCRVFKKNGLGLPKTPGIGLEGEVEQADSPSEEQNSVFTEYEEKPSLELQRLSSSHGAQQPAPLTAIPLDQQALENLPPLVTAMPTPLVGQQPQQPQQQYFGGFNDFEIDGMTFNKVDNNSLDWLQDLSFSEDFAAPLDQAPDARTEFNKGWLLPNELSVNEMQPYAFNIDKFDDLYIPPLMEDQSPSPPPSSAVEDYNAPSTIQIRSRLPGGLRSPNGIRSEQFLAPRFIKFRKRDLAASVEKEDGNEGSEAAGKEGDSVKKDNSTNSPVGEDLDASKAVPASGSEEENEEESLIVLANPTEVSEETVKELSSSSAGNDSVVHPEDKSAQTDESKEQAASSSTIVSSRRHDQVDSCDEHSDVDNQNSVNGLFLKGYGDLPPGIGSIHVNAVTIHCSCDKVSAKPHVQATVCDCYNNSKLVNNQVLQGSGQIVNGQEADEEQSREKRRGGFRRGFVGAFLIGVFSACAGFVILHGVWSFSRQVFRQHVDMISGAGDL